LENNALQIAISRIGIAVWAALFLSFPSAAQQVSELSAELHPWGKFEPGAWKRILVTTETFNEYGTIASTNVTLSTTTLSDIGKDSLTLETQACVEMAGKRFESEPQTVKQGFHGEVLAPNLKIKESAPGDVEIDGRKIPCRVLKLESANSASKTATTIYYSDSVAPHILKRTSKTSDLEGKTVLSETTAELLTLEMPYKIDGETRSAAHLKTVQKSLKGTVVTLAVLCPGIPGGIVAQSSKELDSNGRLVRRGVLELVDYGSEPENDRPGVFGRDRSKRHRTR
jgi:hypothetical protein